MCHVLSEVWHPDFRGCRGAARSAAPARWGKDAMRHALPPEPAPEPREPRPGEAESE